MPFKLSWTHYQILMRIEDKDERDFYEKEAIRSNWNVSTLKRQFHSSLYERLALSRDKNDVMRLANEGAVPQKPEDILHTRFSIAAHCCSPGLFWNFSSEVSMSQRAE